MAHGILLFLGAQDMIVIGVIALLLFGGKKIPEFAKGLGQGIREFKNASDGKPDEKTTPKEDAEKKA
jgi:sec-independent protein translocase protein TatA